MKKYFLLFIILFSGISVHAQFNLRGFYSEYLVEKYRDIGLDMTVDGYPYLEKDFHEAKVEFKDGTVQSYQLRYNNFLDEMEMKQHGRILHVDNRYDVEKIILNDKVYRVYPINKISGLKFFVELVPGKISLLKVAPIEYKPEKQPTGGYQEYLPPRFVKQDPVYYIKLGDKNPEELPSGRKKMINFLNEKGFRGKEIIKKNNIRYNEEDLITLVKLLQE